MDVVYIALSLGFWLVFVGMAKGCANLGGLSQ